MPADVTQPSDVLPQSRTLLSRDQFASYRTALTRMSGGEQLPEPALSQDNSVADFHVTLKSAPESDAAIAMVRGPLRAAAHAAATV